MRSSRGWIELAAVASMAVAVTASGAYVGYSHITASEGAVSILSDANGRLEATLNAPINAGDRISTAAGARVELALADGNRVQLDGESFVRLDALAGSPDSEARESVLTLEDGSLAIESIHSGEDRAVRIDTAEVSIYLAESARVRINTDTRQGTSVIVRSGAAEIQTRTGSRTLSSGQYLTVRGDDEPQIASGNFSRDRFDVWVADRTNGILEAHNSTAARFVDGDYDEDAAAMDSYGEWDYSTSYGVNVWRPHVSSDWSPYSDGYWADSSLGASWVSSEPWGWMPYHYGNWFFDSGFDSWCWAPAYVYSPAWVYWCYSPGWVGWCPVGNYSYYAPYRRFWSPGTYRAGLYISVAGIFNPSRIDFRSGWSFVHSERFGSRTGPGGIVPGRVVAPRLPSRVAVTSELLRSGPASPGVSGVERMRRAIAAAPARIAQTSSTESAGALAPFLARERSLPNETLRVIQQSHLATPGIGRASREISGPGVDRLPVTLKSDGMPGADWRTRDSSFRSFAPAAPVDGAVPREDSRGRETWRERPSTNAPPTPRAMPRESRAESWREQSQAPPARRVIDGIEHGRSAPRAAPPIEPAPRAHASPQPIPAPPLRIEPRSASPHQDLHPAPAPTRASPPPTRAAPPPAPPPPSGADHPHR